MASDHMTNPHAACNIRRTGIDVFICTARSAQSPCALTAAFEWLLFGIAVNRSIPCAPLAAAKAMNFRQLAGAGTTPAFVSVPRPSTPFGTPKKRLIIVVQVPGLYLSTTTKVVSSQVDTETGKAVPIHELWAKAHGHATGCLVLLLYIIF